MNGDYKMSDKVWGYRVVRQSKDGDEWLSVQEVYYDDDETNDIGDPMLYYHDPLLYRQELIFLKNTPRFFKLGLKMNL